MNSPQNSGSDRVDLISLTADIVSAYVSNNAVQQDKLADLIRTVQEAMLQAVIGKVPMAGIEPAIHPKKSITPAFLICLEDGKKFKSLKRHLRTQYNMSPEEYREKWNLPPEYPMVAPNYAQARSKLARNMGLGKLRSRVAETG